LYVYISIPQASSRGLVVKTGDSWQRGPGFKPPLWRPFFRHHSFGSKHGTRPGIVAYAVILQMGGWTLRNVWLKNLNWMNCKLVSWLRPKSPTPKKSISTIKSSLFYDISIKVLILKTIYSFSMVTIQPNKSVWSWTESTIKEKILRTTEELKNHIWLIVSFWCFMWS
jgi:hypothetical protein